MENNKKENELLYQDLPSLAPRVSRTERSMWSRKGGCTDCTSDGMNKARQQSKNLYSFFLALMAIGFVVTQFYIRKGGDPPLVESTKTISVSFQKKIIVSLIDQENRYGISVLFRNNSSQKWLINNITVSETESPETISYPIEYTVGKKKFYSLFIPLPPSFDSIEKIQIIVD